MTGIMVALLVVNLALLLWLLLREVGGGALRRHGERLEGLQDSLCHLEEHLAESRRDVRESLQAQRLELAHHLAELGRSLGEENQSFRREQHEFQEQFHRGMREEFAQGREAVSARLEEIRAEGGRKLEAMRVTVDEKLQSSLERHFNESFKLISERLEQVHKGLGEMQGLAAGVGDLKKVLTNVKTRGNIGEIQLATILEQYLSPEQFVANVSTVPDSHDVVEFAVKMPGHLGEEPVLMPIDSKFPVEDYIRLTEAYELYPRMSKELKRAQDEFGRTVCKCADDIRRKYLYPPRTTGFGMMFVPSEGIYAEVLRMPGLFEKVQQEYKIAIVGPSNLVAFLNALQLGFRTLAIERRSHEVWTILGTVKTEFGKFGAEMDATRKSLQAVVNHMDAIGTRSRVLERSLKDVQALPSSGDGLSD